MQISGQHPGFSIFRELRACFVRPTIAVQPFSDEPVDNAEEFSLQKLRAAQTTSARIDRELDSTPPL